MGPNILLDKSAIQSLSQSEIYKLAKHYNFVSCPVLLIEILGDLKKGQTGDGFSTSEVQQLAQKLLSGGYPCADYQHLIRGDLLGYPVPMTGRVPMAGGRPVTSSEGTGIVFDVSPENQAILRWRNAEFSEAEKVLAEVWREATRALDLEAFQRQYRQILRIHKFKNLDNLHRFVSFITRPRDAEAKEQLMTAVLDEFRIPQNARGIINKRWNDAGRPDLETFAPYTHHCIKVNLMFQYGVITGLITTRRTNRVDTQYFYYAPFCQVFSSRDSLHRDLSAVLLRDDQSFVHGNELKADLNRLVQSWEALSREERIEREYEYGSYPPFDEKSVTHRLWRKHMRPWTPGSGNRAIRMSKEEERELLDKINSMIEGSGRGSQF